MDEVFVVFKYISIVMHEAILYVPFHKAAFSGSMKSSTKDLHGE